MINKDLYLKTMFCCIACDGDIAPEEVNTIKVIATQLPEMRGIEIEAMLNIYISEINKDGVLFLKKYLKELSKEELTEEEQLLLIALSIKMIEADSRIEYSEVKFFKKIRARLSVSDEQILEQHPNKEDFLLPDVNVTEDLIWNENIKFTNISLS
ncbi:MAG: TerB family tellurite resistance protein [Odoribacter sp.]|nr:TerB family tellurite resistance protein [Odoribacter sp.]